MAFVTLEGIDGSGKSTVVGEAGAHFDNVVTTQEPSGFWTGTQVRQAIKRGADVDPLTTTFLFLADRAYHVQEVVLQWSGTSLVVSDRYHDSTVAYQTAAIREEMGIDPWEALIRLGEWFPEPDLTVLLDLPADVAVGRTAREDTFEERGFLSAVRRNYLDLAHGNDRFVVIDADRPEVDVVMDAIETISEHIEQ